MSDMSIALEITALGMGLVFAAIVLLWLMMTVLTAILMDRVESPSDTAASDSAGAGPTKERDIKAQAAAVAVAMALAEQQTSTAHPLSTPPTALVSAWQLGTRTSQLYQKGMPVKRQPRDIGK